MEEGIIKDCSDISMLGQIHETFGESDVDIKTYSPLTLAYIGDAVLR